jgi:hypothetical protein
MTTEDFQVSREAAEVYRLDAPLHGHLVIARVPSS